MGVNPIQGTPVPVPTLLVWSDADPTLGREGAEASRDWVTGPYRFVELPGVSHWVAQEAGERVVHELVSHLAAH